MECNDLIAIAATVLEREAAAIAAQARSLDGDFLAVIHCLAAHRGVTFVAGIGKSGLVGRSLASKLACVGVRAVFLEPLDALHGELGLLGAGDVLVALSKSGTTGELVALAKAAKQRHLKVAVMTCRPGSPLTHLADWVLHVRIDREATDLELPTTSAIAMMALGDAIAIATAAARGVTVADYSRNHPAGNLGVLLGTNVEDVMHRVGVAAPAVLPATLLRDVMLEMTRHPVGAAMVVDAGDRLVGIVTDGDLRRSMQRHPEDFWRQAVSACMNARPITCTVGTSTLAALQLMETNPRKPVYVLPVVDTAGRALGLVRMHDLTALQLREFHSEIG